VQRPFGTRYLAQASAGTLEARIHFQSVPDDEVIRVFAASMHTFVDLANAGALCGEQIAPGYSRIGHARQSHLDATLTWWLSEVVIDPRSVSVLVNIVHFLHNSVAPVSDLAVNWERLRSISDPDRVQFPGAAQPLPFAFSWDEELPAFDIVVDFSSPQGPVSVRQAVASVEAWFGAANLGAYGDDGSPPPINRIDMSPEVSTICEDAVVWYIDRFASTTSAIDGLLNVVSKMHQTIVPVQSLELSE
jgi:hypothetical protein